MRPSFSEPRVQAMAIAAITTALPSESILGNMSDNDDSDEDDDDQDDEYGWSTNELSENLEKLSV